MTAPSTSTQPDRAELLEIWRSVLAAGEPGDPKVAVVAELAEYFEIDRSEALERCVEYVAYSDAEWEDQDRSTADDLIDYWSRRSPIFGILMSHALQFTEEHPASSVDIAETLAGRAPGRLLDYGVGPATSSMFFETLGWEVLGADVSATMLDFARWRAARRDSSCEFIDLRDDDPPVGEFDVVVALEVMAHVPDIPATLTQMRDSLRPGGILIFNVYAPPPGPGTSGHLFVGNYHVLRHVRSAGFARHPRIGKYYMFERVELTPLRKALVTVADRLRHNRVVSDAAQLVRRGLARVRG